MNAWRIWIKSKLLDTNYLGKFPQKLQIKINNISNLLSPYTKRAYLVGGSVRDIFLNNKIVDLDIEVYDISIEKFDELMLKIGAQGVGKSFFVYKLNDIDLALPRVEKKVGNGHKAFRVELAYDEKKASKRRDFTMNAMMINIFDGNFLDFYNGYESICNKKISLIDENSFKEDSLRVLRAIQFSARFGFEIEENTLKIMDEISLNDLSKTRIFWEFEKLFRSNYLHFGFKHMCRLNIFDKIFTCNIDNAQSKNIINELKYAINGFEEYLKEYYFMYIVANMLGLNPIILLKKIDAPTRYINIFKKQPFFKEIPNDRELAIIAIDIPIKNWLGNYKEEIKIRAKKLRIYDETYTRGLNIQDVIKDGFEKVNIKREYRRRLLAKIDKEFGDE